jgi:hypothetical protein
MWGLPHGPSLLYSLNVRCDSDNFTLYYCLFLRSIVYYNISCESDNFIAYGANKLP